MEIWKPIPSCSGWFASSEGRVCKHPSPVSMPNGGTKQSFVAPTFGHHDARKDRFKLSMNGRTRWVAALICEAFNGPRPSPIHECMHLDEDSLNNIPSNLAWGTKAENQSAPKVAAHRSQFMTRLWAARRAARHV